MRKVIFKYTPYWFYRIYLLLWYRPFIKCPLCKGRGGAVSGYYEPEWCECEACWDHYHNCEDAGMYWTVGRLPLWAWCHAWLLKLTGHYTFRGWIFCKIGLHAWHKWGDEPPVFCARCWKFQDEELEMRTKD